MTALPKVVADLLDEWELKTGGEPMPAQAAVVVPVRMADRTAAVLKVSPQHPHVEHEALALQHWHGRGAVRLLKADPHRRATLLERLAPSSLDSLPGLDACDAVAELYGRLHVPAPPQLTLLSAITAGWATQLASARGLPMPPRLVAEAASLARDLARDEATDGVLVHSDLHAGNVLEDNDGDWRAISPKPLSGDPHFELAPMLWHRADVRAPGFRADLRDRFFALVDGAGLDEDRAKAWVVVRVLARINAGVAADPAPDRDWVTSLLSVAKAIRD
ncbi:aminoglycoside phosphotransferase family protein [Nocardioides jejuensis]|uniref:Aminoglycoside resistance protein n=1 Tax=Nocardioides jejuensis TaxID=2502782 RepID=A0A4R1CBJ5_9ACTN|nr:aminoglycoside phosphotransferase family protein [Nocardioides jejuensis]TCJ28081.1 aminoglycoside resistance protein [Nocardioides jejuensis]